jgi:hypothetical protein
MTPALKKVWGNDPDEYDGEGSATICRSPGARIGRLTHRVEEVLVAAAIAAGQPVHRSPSAPPAAVLGVRIEAKATNGWAGFDPEREPPMDSSAEQSGLRPYRELLSYNPVSERQ